MRKKLHSNVRVVRVESHHVCREQGNSEGEAEVELLTSRCPIDSIMTIAIRYHALVEGVSKISENFSVIIIPYNHHKGHK